MILSNIEQWLLANNATKTEHMFIGSDDNLHKITNTSQIHIDGHVLKSIKYSKRLGVYIDEKLNWDEQIDHVSKNVTQAKAGLKHEQSFVSKRVALAIFTL